MKIELSGIPGNLLTRFIADQRRPADTGKTAWGVSLLSLTSIPVTQIAEALKISPAAVRSCRYRNKVLVDWITGKFVNYFIPEAERAFEVATDASLTWMKDPTGPRPHMWQSAFNVYDLIHPRVTVAIMAAMLDRGLIHLLPFLPVEDGLNDFMRGIFRKGLYDSLREFIKHGGDKDLALASLSLLEQENLSN